MTLPFSYFRHLNKSIMNKLFLIAFTALLYVGGNAQELTGKKLLKSASSLAKEGKVVEARDLLNKNYSSEDKWASFLTFELGKLYANSKMLDSADWYFELTKKSNNRKLEDKLNASEASLSQKKEQFKIEILTGWKAMDAGDPKMANQGFDNALLLDTGNYEPYQAKGEILAKEGKMRAAVLKYQKALTKFFPDSKDKTHLMEHLAAAQIKMGDPYSAIKTCRLGLQLEPENQELLFLTATAYYAQKMFLEANTNFIKVIRLAPDHTQAWFYSGSSYYAGKDYSNAIKCFNSCLKYDSNYYSAYSERAKTYIAMNKYEEAKKDYAYLVKIMDGNFYAMNAAGICDFHSENYEKAVKNFQNAVALSPTKSYKYNLARAYMENNQNEEALIICEEFAESSPTNKRFNIIHVKCLMRLKRFTEAEVYLNQSITKNPHVLEYLELGAELFEITGNQAASKNATSIGGDLNVDRINQDLRF